MRHLNVESAVLRSLAVKMIDANQPVWFGCDVGKESHRDMAVMDTELLDYELVYATPPSLASHPLIFTTPPMPGSGGGNDMAICARG